jgi:RNA polymerase sigma-70 factor (ECF subfamily)
VPYTPKDSDSQLFAEARSGDTEALACLVDRHKDRLVNYLSKLTGNRDRAEDVAQEAFLRLLERSSGYVERGKLQAYLYRIATNLVRSQGRREQRWRTVRTLFLHPNGHHSDPPQQSRLLQDELQDRLATALRKLPLRYRTAIVLSHVEGWSYRDISTLMGCREGTVKSRIFRARQLLQRELKPYLHGGAS